MSKQGIASIQPSIWATLLWIDTKIANYEIDFNLYKSKNLKIKVCLQELKDLEKDYVLYPKTYAYLVELKRRVRILLK